MNLEIFMSLYNVCFHVIRELCIQNIEINAVYSLK